MMKIFTLVLITAGVSASALAAPFFPGVKVGKPIDLGETVLLGEWESSGAPPPPWEVPKRPLKTRCAVVASRYSENQSRQAIQEIEFDTTDFTNGNIDFTTSEKNLWFKRTTEGLKHCTECKDWKWLAGQRFTLTYVRGANENSDRSVLGLHAKATEGGVTSIAASSAQSLMQYKAIDTSLSLLVTPEKLGAKGAVSFMINVSCRLME